MAWTQEAQAYFDSCQTALPPKPGSAGAVERPRLLSAGTTTTASRRPSSGVAASSTSRRVSRCSSLGVPCRRDSKDSIPTSGISGGFRLGSKSSGASDQERRPSLSGARFTDREREGFGRFSYLASSSSSSSLRRRNSRGSWASQLPVGAFVDFPGRIVDDEPRQSNLDEYDHGQVREMLERMLPRTKDLQHVRTSSHSLPTQPCIDERRLGSQDLRRGHERQGSKEFTSLANDHEQLSRAATTAPQTPSGLHTEKSTARTRPGSSRESADRASAPVTPSLGASGDHGDGLNNCGENKRYQKEVLERFRKHLLERFLSLHDAFSRLDHTVSRTKALTRLEFLEVLKKLNAGEEEAAELFQAMDTRSDGGVALSEFLHALVDISPEALLWELRCRLVHMNIWPHCLSRALELVRWPQHGWMSRATKVKRQSSRRTCSRCGANLPLDGQCKCKGQSLQPDPTAEAASGTMAVLVANAFPELAATPGFALWSPDKPDPAMAALYDSLDNNLSEDWRQKPSRFHLTRGEWLKFCTSLYLTLLEAERLQRHLADDAGFVDLQQMFETLRCTVEPDISLERFAVKVQSRYQTPANAFAKFAEEDMQLSPEPTLSWRGFHNMAVKLQVNDRNAERLWQVLLRGSGERTRTTVERGWINLYRERLIDWAGMEAVLEYSFDAELKAWAPESPLRHMKESLCDRFGCLAEAQRLLSQKLSRTSSVSAKQLRACLRTVGIEGIDVLQALKSVSLGSVSVEEIFEAMHDLGNPQARHSSQRACESAVRSSTEPLRHQIRLLEEDCHQPLSRTAPQVDSSLQLTLRPGQPGVGLETVLKEHREEQKIDHFDTLRRSSMTSAGHPGGSPLRTSSCGSHTSSRMTSSIGQPRERRASTASSVPPKNRSSRSTTSCDLRKRASKVAAVGDASSEDRPSLSTCIRNAMRGAETRHSKNVLQQAEKQILKLEKRFASTSSLGGWSQSQCD